MAAMTLAAHLAAGLNLFAVSPLLPLAIDDYGISRAQAGMLISLPMLVGALLGIPGGMLAARIGLKRAYMLSWLSMSLLALSAITPSFPAMLLLRLSYGVGLALMVSASGPLVMQWFRRREILIINALNTAILSLGVAISVAGAVPLAQWLDWKTALTVFSGVGVIGAILWTLAPKAPPSAPSESPHQTRKSPTTYLHRAGNPPTTSPRQPGNPPNQLTPTAGNPPTDSPPPGANTRSGGISVREVLTVLRGRAVALLVAADAGIFIQYTALTGWLPTFYHEARGLSPSEAGLLTSILPFVGIFAVIAGGALPMRFSYRSILLLSGVLAIAGGLGSFLLTPAPAIYLSVVALGIGSWLYVPTLLTIPIRLPGATPERVAVIWGSFMTFSGIGMFIAPIMVGAIRDAAGSYLTGFLICAAASWALLISGILLPPIPTTPDTPE